MMDKKEYVEREINCFDDCFHNPICLLRIHGDEWKRCVYFKNKADVVEVRHGVWLINPDGYYPYCSECNQEPQGRIMTKWCPNCGAKMDLRHTKK